MIKKSNKRITITLPEKLVDCIDNDSIFMVDVFSRSDIIKEALVYWLKTRVLTGYEIKEYLVDN